jgi:hypothetical protein
MDVFEAARSDHQLAQDQKVLALAEHRRRRGYRAVFAIGGRGIIAGAVQQVSAQLEWIALDCPRPARRPEVDVLAHGVRAVVWAVGRHREVLRRA